MGSQSYLFEPENHILKIYKRSNFSLNPVLLDFPSSFSRLKIINNEPKIPDTPIMNIQTLADQLLLHQFSPAGVLVNENGDIIYINGRTGKYLEPAVGKANLNIFAMLRPGFQNDFAVAFRKVIAKREEVVLHNVKIVSNESAIIINVNIHWINKPGALYGKVLIIFTDVLVSNQEKAYSKLGEQAIISKREKDIEDELQHSREEVQNILEEMQTSQEELKSTNEELQSTNEELQSTNEELTTSKEEMQSLNEELQTVNAELQSKLDDYSRVNNDMKNLLNSTDIATLFLDKELNIRRYTNQATKIFKLIQSDIGRPFTDQVSQLIYPELAEDAFEVLRTLIFIEKQIPTKDGSWFLIRIMPYRTFDDHIDGLVITFINISELKLVEEGLNAANQLYSLLLNSSNEIIIKLSIDWKIIEYNWAAEDFFGMKRQAVLNQNFIKLFIPKLLRDKTELQLNQLLAKTNVDIIEMKVLVANGNEIEIKWKTNIIFDSQKLPLAVIIITKSINHE